MVELGLPSLNAVYDMTWREFLLRKSGYHRKEKNEWHKVRMISYWSGAGTGFDNSKLSIDRFMPIDDNKKQEADDSGKEAFNKAFDEYLKKVNKKNGS